MNFECFVTLNDRKFMKLQLNNEMKIEQLFSSLSMKKINDKLIKINDFVIINLFFVDINVVDEFIIVVISIEVHLINDLKINMFVDVNVLKFQKMILNFEHNIFVINNCDVTIIIDFVNRVKFYIKRIIRNRKIFVVLFDQLTEISITFRDDLSKNKDFLFESQCSTYLNQNDDVFAHIVDSNFFFVQIHNITNLSMLLKRRARLKFVMKYNQQKCYQIIVNEASKIVCD